MINPLYRSFVPYILLLVIILIAVFIFDSYAEKISREPEVISLSGEEAGVTPSALKWQMENEIALKDETGPGQDSLFHEAMKLYRVGNLEEAEEITLFLLNRDQDAPAVWNLRGIIAVQQLEHGAAEEHFLKALEWDPAYYEARTNLASLYMNMHRYGDAEKQYLRARTGDPYDPGICYNLGLLYSSMEMNEAAVNAFTEAIDLSSGKRKAKALIQKGIVQLGMRDTLSARENLNEAILLDPGNEQARLQLALTYRDPAKREAELLRIYRLNPGSFDANYLLGRLYRDQGKYPSAEYHYQKALEKNAYNEKIMAELGTMLIGQNRLAEAELVLSGFSAGDTLPQSYFYQAKIATAEGMIPEAISLYELAIEKSLNAYPEANLNMAILYKQQSQLDKAIECYREAITARPDYSLAYYNLALLYTEADSSDQAIACYRESIRTDPGALKSWYNLGRLYDQREETRAAIDAYQHALQINPEYPKAMLALGNAYLKENNLDQAVLWYRTMLDRYPNYSKAWFNLGLAHSRMEETGRAMQAYEKLIEIDPGNVRGRINLAILYGRNDRVELAIAVLEDAMDLAPDNPDIRFNLALQQKKLEEFDKATYQFLQVIELEPGYRQAYRQLMQLFLDEEDVVNYEVISFRYQKEFGFEGDIYETGKRLHELEQPGLALEAYNLARDAGDDRIWLDYWTGKALMDLGSLEEAIGWFQVVLTRDEAHKFSLYRLGQIYEMKGETEKAASYYTALLELDSDFRIVHKPALQSNL
jgi:tetratricopeptide (TPR) repeat protein